MPITAIAYYNVKRKSVMDSFSSNGRNAMHAFWTLRHLYSDKDARSSHVVSRDTGGSRGRAIRLWPPRGSSPPRVLNRRGWSNKSFFRKSVMEPKSCLHYLLQEPRGDFVDKLRRPLPLVPPIAKTNRCHNLLLYYRHLYSS